MAKETDQAKEVQRDHREYCYVCYRVKKNCLCGSVKPFSTQMRFVILMHTKEAKKEKTGTARLARLCLKNAELLIGTDFSRDERVNALLRDPAYFPVLLYPGPQAVNFETHGSFLRPEGKTLLVFVADGTWDSVRRLLFKSRNIQALPRLSFSRSYNSRFIIKKQPGQGYISTIEAIYYLCGEAEAAGYENLKAQSENLMVLFKKMVDTQLHYQEKVHQVRYLDPKTKRKKKVS
ncbi:MAG TPA: tRNA-uridine aminocarboxypropyltransferase [Elusimicrobiales bacterium]|nr:tRNA-uridine aminocarboxypropyltransferase [Elusimicrobiales bacterium]